MNKDIRPNIVYLRADPTSPTSKTIFSCPPQKVIDAAIRTYLDFFNKYAVSDKEEKLSDKAYHLASDAKRALDGNAHPDKKHIDLAQFRMVIVCLTYYLYFVRTSITDVSSPQLVKKAKFSFHCATLYLFGAVAVASHFDIWDMKVIKNVINHCPIPKVMRHDLIKQLNSHN